MLKVDFHIHTGSDPLDKLSYTDEELIDKASDLSFDAISITNHNACTYAKELADYAESKGILLIPGSEITINGRHVIVLNITQRDVDEIKTFDDLRKLKSQKDILVIAPHPYFVLPNCLSKKLIQNIDIFDAVEYSYFHTKWINFNRKAKAAAEKFSKTLIAQSDTHILKCFGNTYSFVDAEKDFKSIKKAVIGGKVKIVSPPLRFSNMLWTIFMMLFGRGY
ncbi:MAG: PHP domain-containing protein [Nanoarchaeota archaeon]|nr:PHP domain-containing protein [Nanoarchaeota archaeon]